MMKKRRLGIVIPDFMEAQIKAEEFCTRSYDSRPKQNICKEGVWALRRRIVDAGHLLQGFRRK